MKRNFILTAAVVLIMTASCFAGPFSDVPKGHYGYDVLKQAQDLGLITTDVSGTMTRYEMATAVAEILSKQDIILAQAKTVKKKPVKPVKPAVKPIEKIEKVEPVKVEPVKPIDPRKFVTKGELQETLADYATKDEAKKAVADATKDVAKTGDLVGLATKADVDANKKSIDEFKAALGRLSKDLKEELAGIGVRLSDLEKGQAELKDKVSDLEKKIPNVGGEIRVRGINSKEGDEKASTSWEQRTRVSISKILSEGAVATVQVRSTSDSMSTKKGAGGQLELANVAADTKLGKITVGYQYFKLDALGLLVQDSDNSTGALLWEKALGKIKLTGLYALTQEVDKDDNTRIIAGRIALPIGAGEIGGTMRLAGPDANLVKTANDSTEGMAVDLKIGPICAEYSTYENESVSADKQTAIVATIKLGKRLSLTAINNDIGYGLNYSITSVTQEDLPLILTASQAEKDTTRGVGVNLALGALDVEVAKVMEDSAAKDAMFGGIDAKGGLAARVTYTTYLAPSVQLQIRGEQIGTKVDVTEGGRRVVRGQLLVKF